MTVLGVVGIQVVVPGLFRSLNNLFFAIGTDASTTSRTEAFSSAATIYFGASFVRPGFGTFMPNIYFFTDDEYLNAAIEIGLVGSSHAVADVHHRLVSVSLRPASVRRSGNAPSRAVHGGFVCGHAYLLCYI